jgi:hypothetical protein
MYKEGVALRALSVSSLLREQAVETAIEQGSVPARPGSGWWIRWPRLAPPALHSTNRHHDALARRCSA